MKRRFEKDAESSAEQQPEYCKNFLNCVLSIKYFYRSKEDSNLSCERHTNFIVSSSTASEHF